MVPPTTGHSRALILQETIIFAAAGKGTLVTNPGGEKELQRHELSVGDFAFVPPWTEHQEINESDEELVWVIIRNGSTPILVYLKDWGGDEQKAN